MRMTTNSKLATKFTNQLNMNNTIKQFQGRTLDTKAVCAIGVTFSSNLQDEISKHDSDLFSYVTNSTSLRAAKAKVVAKPTDQKISDRSSSHVATSGTFTISVDFECADFIKPAVPLQAILVPDPNSGSEVEAPKPVYSTVQLCSCEQRNGARTYISRGVTVVEQAMWYGKKCGGCHRHLFPEAASLRRGARAADKSNNAAKPKTAAKGRKAMKPNLNKTARAFNKKRQDGPLFTNRYRREPNDKFIQDRCPTSTPTEKKFVRRVYPKGDCGVQAAFNIFKRVWEDENPFFTANSFESTLAQLLTARKDIACSWMTELDLDALFKALQISCFVVVPDGIPYKNEPASWHVHSRLGCSGQGSTFVKSCAVYIATELSEHYSVMDLEPHDTYKHLDVAYGSIDLACTMSPSFPESDEDREARKGVHAPQEFRESESLLKKHRGSSRAVRANFIRMASWVEDGDMTPAQIARATTGTYGMSDMEFQKFAGRGYRHALPEPEPVEEAKPEEPSKATEEKLDPPAPEVVKKSLHPNGMGPMVTPEQFSEYWKNISLLAEAKRELMLRRKAETAPVTPAKEIKPTGDGPEVPSGEVPITQPEEAQTPPPSESEGDASTGGSPAPSGDEVVAPEPVIEGPSEKSEEGHSGSAPEEAAPEESFPKPGEEKEEDVALPTPVPSSDDDKALAEIHRMELLTSSLLLSFKEDCLEELASSGDTGHSVDQHEEGETMENDGDSIDATESVHSSPVLEVNTSVQSIADDAYEFTHSVLNQGFQGKWGAFKIESMGSVQNADAKWLTPFKQARAQRNVLVKECFLDMYEREGKWFPHTRIWLNSFRTTFGTKVPTMKRDRIDMHETVPCDMNGYDAAEIESWMMPQKKVRQNSIRIERAPFLIDALVDVRVESYKIVEATLLHGIAGYAHIIEWVPVDLENEADRMEIITRVKTRMFEKMQEKIREGRPVPNHDQYRKIMMALLTRESVTYRKVVQKLEISCEVLAQLVGNPKIFMFDCREGKATEKRVSAYIAGVVSKVNISKYAAVNGQPWVQNTGKAALHLMQCYSWRVNNCDVRESRIRRGQHYLVGYHTDEKLMAPVTIKPSLHISKIKQPDTSRLDRKPAAVGSGMECIGAVRPHADCMDAISIADGVRGRLGREPPKPIDETHFKQLKLYTKCFVRKHGWAAKMAEVFDVSRLDIEDFLARTPYPEARKEELRECNAEFAATCENYVDVNDDAYKRYITLVDQFCKDEFYDDWKLPRLINARVDTFKVLFGPWVKMIEDVIYDHEGCVKHIPVQDRPAYIMDLLEKDGLIFYATDWSAMETHNYVAMMSAIMCTVIEEMCFDLPFFKNLFQMLEDLKGEQTMKFKFFTVTVMATVMSGEMWTALINWVTNIVNVNFFLEKEGMITGLGCFNGTGMMVKQSFYSDLDERARVACNEELVNCERLMTGSRHADSSEYDYCDTVMKTDIIPGVYEGDDSLIALRSEWPRLNAGHFARYGLIMKLSFEENLNEASFCGLVFDRESKASLTNPLKYLCKGFLARKYAGASSGKKNGLMRATAMSLLHSYPACPVLAHYCRAILAMTRGADARYVLKDKQLDLFDRVRFQEALSNTRWDQDIKPITMGSRVVVEKVFGVPIAAQLAMEEYFTTLLTKTEPEVMYVPCLSLCVPDSWIDNWNEYVHYGECDHNNVPIIIFPSQKPMLFPVSTSTHTGMPIRS